MAVKTFTTGEVLTAADTNTYLNNGGLVYIGQTTVTSGTNADITSCFNATYDSYRVVCSDLRSSTTTGISLTLLSSTTPAASNWVWISGRLDYATAAWNIQKNSSDSRINSLTVSTTSASAAVIDILNPFSSQYTTVIAQGLDSRGATGYMLINTTGQLANTTSYNGLRIYCDSAATYSNAKIIVYGYRQA